MTDVDGQRKKVTSCHGAVAFTLQVCVFNEHPFTTETAVEAHEAAFAFFADILMNLFTIRTKCCW